MTKPHLMLLPLFPLPPSLIRSASADFLVSGGPSKTWSLGNYLVTVTATGEAGAGPGRCARCVTEMGGGSSPSAGNMAATSLLQGERGERGERGRGSEAGIQVPVAPKMGGSSPLCSCWCWGWAEVKVRRPSGNTAWMMQLQNRLRRVYSLSREEGQLASLAAAYQYPFEDGVEEDRVVNGVEVCDSALICA